MLSFFARGLFFVPELSFATSFARSIINSNSTWSFYIIFQEEERLSAIVTRITNEFIVPRGALIKSPEGAVFKNYSYYGMNENDTAHLSNWLHLRGEMARPMPKVTDFADADPAIGNLISDI